MLTPTHLAIVMEYAAGGELFERICNAGRFSEDEVRRAFPQRRFWHMSAVFFWTFWGNYAEDEFTRTCGGVCCAG